MLLFVACAAEGLPPEVVDTAPVTPPDTMFIAAHPQRDGDPDAGRDYLVNGDYVGAGIPLDIWRQIYADDPANVLGRSGENATLGPDVTWIETAEGSEAVVQNCLTCHGAELMGTYHVGLGNTTLASHVDPSGFAPQLEAYVRSVHGQDSPEFQNTKRYTRAIKKVGPELVTETRGANFADNLAALLAAHRDPDSLEWTNSALLDYPAEMLPADVPPWWHLEKKHAMFYAGIGRADFGRFLMTSAILTLDDLEEAETIDARFPDLFAYLRTLEAPVYPGEVDAGLVAEGEELFLDRCASCHGVYAEDGDTYPNLLVSMDSIGTDPLLFQGGGDSPFVDWFNTSWFAEGDHGAWLQFDGGYVAPPLDGVWATAPYLHNGSVPKLSQVLDSSSRPELYRRSFQSDDYDLEDPGWNYTEVDEKSDSSTWDASIPGYGNQGHTYGDDLSDEERAAVVEYLKTL